MPKFTKKPVTVTAVRFNGSTTHANQIENWVNGGEEPKKDGIHTRDIRPIILKTPTGIITATLGDWIVKDANGEFSLCKPDIFTALYQPAE